MKRALFCSVVLFSIVASAMAYGGIVGSKHDLVSDWNKGSLLMRQTLNNYLSPCVYCHTPHDAASNAGAPLWNRPVPVGPYTTYQSPTMNTTVSNPPDSASLVCLSCHDGTIAVDAVLKKPSSFIQSTYHYKMLPEANACGECHNGGPAHDARGTYLTTDLSNDHPVSMDYPTPVQDPDFVQPKPSDLLFFNGKVECPTCHDPHKTDYGNFLRKSNTGSALCLSCHIK
ncbi:doubled CXXCH motif [bacterium BMS3Abin07]|nr:doubled CXXCH motif [bacterium BMS3Abin07]GBE32201.1 doubled CXXCH motif [bacterium BMS3Bbin05]HDO22774.1 hypothetical protein [Nitrospirota bacterium]HDZ88821.1 hypothetical protein [Nitrospirota bacterium]